MKGKRLGIAPLLLIVVLAVSMAGAVALWYDTLSISVNVETGELDWEFMNNSAYTDDACYNNVGEPLNNPDYNAFPTEFSKVIAPDGKDVGCTELNLIDTDSDGDYDRLNITLHNVYPYYTSEVDFRVQNIGTIPLKIWRIVVILDNGTSYEYTEINPEEVETEGLYLDLNDDSKPDVIMLWGDNFGVQLETGQTADISLTLIVLQTAPQNATLHFQIGLDAVQWNEYNDVIGSGW